ncbi:hypothetical protein P4388_10980 [Bacillus thuringiensis]|uniref:Uncharacterized protein n=1 Tax=Bacillus thuringiensis serovar toumanoffi TaxID=180862 RepID=A0ABD5I8K5_BACTU|nr:MULTISPECIES: hypothetical protein [Bacillus cereus group]AMR88610.1 hypothetical protein A3L20_32095 [Bacillus thuringiensis]EEM93045.1 hypothetical protein bthur0013_55780 [Bacillus thuringiensis IBL 200]MBG9640711.1 hypothetical protein [Bacillus thuringiensis]MBG9677048.1 hypothetical protein [Bacillus thuringiensis]MCR6783658.1 hypothetical protein [Bacillus thuringiensis]
MKVIQTKSLVKRCTSIALAGVIGVSGLGAFGTSVSADENVSHVKANQVIQNQDMTISQLQDAIQQKNDPFINQVKIFINKHFQESEFLWGKVSNSLKKDIVDILTGDEKDYSAKINKALINYYREVPSLLRQATPKFKREILQLLNYLPR